MRDRTLLHNKSKQIQHPPVSTDAGGGGSLSASFTLAVEHDARLSGRKFRRADRRSLHNVPLRLRAQLRYRGGRNMSRPKSKKGLQSSAERGQYAGRLKVKNKLQKKKKNTSNQERRSIERNVNWDNLFDTKYILEGEKNEFRNFH